MKKPYIAPAFDLICLPTPEGEKEDPRLCNLAHDLNNKLSVIVANCDLLLAGEKALDQDMAQRIRQIKLVALYMGDQIQKRQCPMTSSEEAKAAKA